MSSTNLSELIRTGTPSAGGGGGPLPAGDYSGIVVSLERANASTGTKGFKVVTKVTEGEFAGKDVWDFVYVTERNVGVFLARMGAYGATQDAMADAILDGNDHGVLVLASQVVDTPVVLTVEVEAYGGKNRNKVKFVKPSGSANPLAAPAPAAAPAAPAASARPTSPF